MKVKEVKIPALKQLGSFFASPGYENENRSAANAIEMDQEQTVLEFEDSGRCKEAAFEASSSVSWTTWTPGALATSCIACESRHASFKEEALLRLEDVPV